MKEIFIARNALAAYLISSAVSFVVVTIGVSIRYKGRYMLRMTARAVSLVVPMTTLSGLMKVSMADPSRRNSGLETTSNDWGTDCFSRMKLWSAAAVPTGTVLLITTILYSSMA